MTKTIITSFSVDGVAKTGLTPLITIIEVADGSVDINGVAMTELANGFYKYSFSAYDHTKDYVISIDGTATLNNYERYNYGTIDKEQEILAGVKNRIKRDGTTETIYDDNATTALYTFNLKKADASAAGELDIAYEKVPV